MVSDREMDIVERLRATGNDEPYDWSVCQEAAAEIERLRAAKQDDGAVIAGLQGEIEQLRAALVALDTICDFGADFEPCACFPNVDDLRRAAEMARAALVSGAEK